MTGQTLTAAELLETVMAETATGEVVASRNNFQTFHRVFVPEKVNPAYTNLLASSALMFVTLDHLQEGLDAIIQFLESKGFEEVAASAITLNASVAVTKSVAIEGIRGVSKKFGLGG